MSSPKGSEEKKRVRADSIESIESIDSLEDPFDVNYDPKDGQGNYDRPTALGTDPNSEQQLSFKSKARQFCEDPHSSTFATWFHLFYATIIIASCVAFCTETLNFKGDPEGRNLSVDDYELLEILFTTIFTVDIVIRASVAARVCCCCSQKNKVEGDEVVPVAFFLDIMVIFDILSVLPLPFKALIDATGLSKMYPWLGSSVRVLSICRILRIFKVTRNFEGAKVLFVTMKNSSRPLMVSFIVLIAVMSIVSAVLFFVEPCHGNDCEFTDQMNAAYFLVITLTTIGYGDQIPQSHGGKFVAIVIAFLGSFYMAMPLAIIGSKFEEAYKEHQFHSHGPNLTIREDDLKEQLNHVSLKERRDRVLRLGFKISEIVNLSIKSHDSESRFHMKAFPKKAEIMCSDISFLFEEAMKGTLLDRNMTVLERQSTMQKMKAGIKARAKEKRARDRRSRGPLNRGVRTDLMLEVHEAHKAKQSSRCRDKIWLAMNAKGPNQTKYSRRFRGFQLAIVFLSIGIVALETLPELNSYGPDSRMCKQVVSHFCKKYVLDSDDPEARLKNPACFPLEVEVNGQNVTYKGCNVENGNYDEECDFPNAAAAMTCIHSPYKLDQFNVDTGRANNITTNFYSNGISRQIDYTVGTVYSSNSLSDASTMNTTGRVVVRNKEGKVLLDKLPYDPVLAFDPTWAGLEGDKDIPDDSITSICDRTQCTDNNVRGTNYPVLFFYGEMFFIVIFTVEIIARIFVMRSCRTFWLNVSNIIDVSAALVALAEIVWIPMQWGKTAYEVWGMGGSMDPATFRVTRILVAVRFISLQGQTGGLTVISETLNRTWRKLVIPSVFFFLFTLLFAGIFYTFESGALYMCPESINARMDNGEWVHRKFIEPDWPTRTCTNSTCCRYCVNSDPREGLDVVNPRDGSCNLLVSKSDDTLTYTMIEDMFDAMWTMIITMTTVGYGGKYPLTMTGKLVALVSAILGSLYMAMPLTIVGNEFNKVYDAIEQQRTKAMYKSAQLLHKKKLESEGKSEEKPGFARTTSSLKQLKGLNLAHVISLKRWVRRTKKELQIQDLSEEEQLEIQSFLKKCHKMCRISLHTNEELINYEKAHCKMLNIISKHCIHRHAEGIDTIEATLY